MSDAIIARRVIERLAIIDFNRYINKRSLRIPSGNRGEGSGQGCAPHNERHTVRPAGDSRATCLDRFIEYYRKNFVNNSDQSTHWSWEPVADARLKRARYRSQRTDVNAIRGSPSRQHRLNWHQCRGGRGGTVPPPLPV